MDLDVRPHIIEVEQCGSITCYIQGDLETKRDGVVFLTIHDLGCTFLNWYNFVMQPSMDNVRKRALFIHVAVPGQEPGASILPNEYKFPKMKELGLNLVNILDNLRVPRVVGLGNGAGANIILRFAMDHPSRVVGTLNINASASVSLGRFTEKLTERMTKISSHDVNKLNKRNVEKFADAYKRRTEILSSIKTRLRSDVLLISGGKSKVAGDSEVVHREATAGISSLIKLDDVCEPLVESPQRVADSLLLFCQGLGLLASLSRRPSDLLPAPCTREKGLMDPCLAHHIVDLENCGPVSVFIQGDLNDVVFLTVHNVGSSYMSWKNLVNDNCMEDVKKRAAFIHVALPGQEPGAADLPENYLFPKIKDLALQLVSVLDFFRVRQVVAMGDGAGANIITRFAVFHPGRVLGIFTINNRGGVSMGRFVEGINRRMKEARGEDSQAMNERNVAMFVERFKKRSEILSELKEKIKFDVLLMTGGKSKYVEDAEDIYREITPGLCSLIKIEGISEPLTDALVRVAEAIILFCQGLGLMPSIQRKFSIQGSFGSQGSDHKESKSSEMKESRGVKFHFPDIAEGMKLPEVSANFEQVIMG